jgi:hypothetical protein
MHLLIHYIVISSVCPKRTLILEDNTYFDMCPIAVQADMVKWAMVTLSPTYLLDYFEDDDVRRAAQQYHIKTMELFKRAQNQFEVTDPDTWRASELVPFYSVTVLLMHDYVCTLPVVICCGVFYEDHDLTIFRR